jgi:hypothetical protein
MPEPNSRQKDNPMAGITWPRVPSNRSPRQDNPHTIRLKIGTMKGLRTNCWLSHTITVPL